MSERDEQFEKRLWDLFVVEARESVALISAGIESLEEGAAGDAFEALFREAHTLKGAARSVGAGGLERVGAAIEDLFACAKAGRLAWAPRLRASLLEAVDALGRAIESEQGPAVAIDGGVVTALQAHVADLPGGRRAPEQDEGPRPPPAPPPAAASMRASSADTVRVSSAALEAVLSRCEAISGHRLSAQRQAGALRELRDEVALAQRELTTIRADIRSLTPRLAAAGSGDPKAASAIRATIEHIDGALQARVEEERARGWALRTLAHDAIDETRTFTAAVSALMEDTQRLASQPCGTTFERLGRTTRELSRDLGKEADLRITGGDLEFDRRVLDELAVVTNHLVRNAIDHGIEPAQSRERAGKPRRGCVSVAARALAGGRVGVVVEDDGAGIDFAALAGRAPPGDEIGSDDTVDLVFRSGVSTRDAITDVSGRGLGLAIVKEKVERLGGTVSVASEAGTGTRFSIELPSSRTTLRCMLLECGDELFALPGDAVERVVRIRPDEVATVEGRETIGFDGAVLAYAALADVLDAGQAAAPVSTAGRFLVAVLASGGRRAACRIDGVLGVEEVIVKSLGPQLRDLPAVTGMTVLAAGRIVPVLDPKVLLDRLRSGGRLGVTAPTAPGTRAAQERRRILVVEDSITARTLLCGILEAEDYEVSSAVDGADALARLDENAFDLVVSDIEMPRLGGFELTAKIRADAQLCDLPVILVTTLDARAEREHGLLVGANAYLTKRGFDQSELLDTIRGLLQ